MNEYLTRVMISVDELVNVLTGGSLDETISSRSGRAASYGIWWGRALSGMLGFFFPSHCKLAELHDTQRAKYIAWLYENNLVDPPKP